MQVQSHDVAHLLHEQRVGRELEGLGPMRLEREGPPNPVDTRGPDPARLGHGPHAPLGGVARGTLQRLHDDRFDLGVTESPRGAGARLVEQPVESPLHETRPPLADRLMGHAQVLSDDHVGAPRRAPQNDLRAERQPLRGLPPPHPPLERLALARCDHQPRHRPSQSRHVPAPPLAKMPGGRTLLP